MIRPINSFPPHVIHIKTTKNVAHTVAYSEVPFLVPVNLLEAVSYTMPSTEWEHINVWKCPYKMRFQSAEIQQFWFEIDDKYVRAMKAKITDLKYEEYNSSWSNIGTPWGFPHIIEEESTCTYNRLAIADRGFDNKTEAEIDYEHFLSEQDTDFTEFCNDIFDDGRKVSRLPLSAFAGGPSQNVGKSFIRSYAAVCLEGAIIVLDCFIFSLFASAYPWLTPTLRWYFMVWSYIGELVFNVLVPVGAVKMADNVVCEMMGL